MTNGDGNLRNLSSEQITALPVIGRTVGIGRFDVLWIGNLHLVHVPSVRNDAAQHNHVFQIDTHIIIYICCILECLPSDRFAGNGDKSD